MPTAGSGCSDRRLRRQDVWIMLLRQRAYPAPPSLRSGGSDRRHNRRDKFADTIGQVLAIAGLLDQTDNRAADDDGVSHTGNGRSLFRIGNAQTYRNRETSTW